MPRRGRISHQALAREALQRFADRRAADAEVARELGLGDRAAPGASFSVTIISSSSA